MSTETISDVTDEYMENDEDFPYRFLSKGAVVSVLLGVLSLLGYLFPGLLVLAAVGSLAGLVALSKIRQYPQEFSGKSLAVFGIILNLGILVSGGSWHAYEYATEVPEGFQRISFAEL